MSGKRDVRELTKAFKEEKVYASAFSLKKKGVLIRLIKIRIKPRIRIIRQAIRDLEIIIISKVRQRKTKIM